MVETSVSNSAMYNTFRCYGRSRYRARQAGKMAGTSLTPPCLCPDVDIGGRCLDCGTSLAGASLCCAAARVSLQPLWKSMGQDGEAGSPGVARLAGASGGINQRHLLRSRPLRCRCIDISLAEWLPLMALAIHILQELHERLKVGHPAVARSPIGPLPIRDQGELQTNKCWKTTALEGSDWKGRRARARANRAMLWPPLLVCPTSISSGIRCHELLHIQLRQWSAATWAQLQRGL